MILLPLPALVNPTGMHHQTGLGSSTCPGTDWTRKIHLWSQLVAGLVGVIEDFCSGCCAGPLGPAGKSAACSTNTWACRAQDAAASLSHCHLPHMLLADRKSDGVSVAPTHFGFSTCCCIWQCSWHHSHLRQLFREFGRRSL